MQVKELESKGLSRKLQVVVEAASINAEIEAQLKAAGERVRIPGFRPGYIPMKILQQRYGKSVLSDVLDQAVRRASAEAIAEKKFKPALTPRLHIEDYQSGGDLVFTTAFEILPEIPSIEFAKITLDRKTFDIGDKEVEDTLARIAEGTPALERLEGGKAQKGNVVVIDFKGSMDGKLFEGGSASNFRLELGSGQFIEGFEDQLIGAKEGEERTVEVTFPKDYGAENLAGKDASFAVTVKEIYRKDVPAVDDAFAKARGFADLAAMREAARRQMAKEYDQIVRGHLKKQLFDSLEKQCAFELPPSMVELEFNTIWERVKEARERGDASLKSRDEDELKEEYKQIAARRVKLGLVLADVGNRQNIQITREELSRAAMQQASLFPGQEKKVMEFYQNNPSRVDDLRGPILEEKAVDWILSQVKYNDHKVPLDKLAEEEEESSEAPKSKKKASKKKAK